MKYIFLWYCDEHDWERLGEQEQKRLIRSGLETMRELKASGRYLGGYPLHSTATATSIRARGGQTFITDGPFAETHQQLGGYQIIEAENLDEAIAIGKRLHGGHALHTLEIRPVLDLSALM